MREIKIFAVVFLLFAGFAATGYAQNGDTLPNDDSGIGIVVIDPGHGGQDLGAISGSALEKDIVLDIALKLGRYISNAFPEIKVIYTRQTDIFIPLYKRAEVANKYNADLFISIHVNTVQQSYVNGTETYVLGSHDIKNTRQIAQKENEVIFLEDNHSSTYQNLIPDSTKINLQQISHNQHIEESTLFAAAIQKQFRDRAKLADRRVKKAGFLVLRQINMPGVLIEAGFLSHPNERIYLMSEAGRDYLASSIYLAFKDFKNEIKKNKSHKVLAEENNDNKNREKENATMPECKSHTKNDIWFSVQVAAFSKQKKISPKNFQNETTIFEQSSSNFHRYFSGRFSNIEKAREEETRLQAKFSGAFIVAFENEKLISVKKALRKM